MSSIVYADAFVEDVSRIYSERVLEALDKRLAAIEAFPALGSSDIRPSLSERYGPGLRKFPVPPFVIIYRYTEAADRLEFITLPYDQTIT